MSLRRLYLVLGDQLDTDSVLDADFDPQRDGIWMAERRSEAKRAWSHKMRLVYFISAMRHFRQQIHGKGWPLTYRSADDHPDDSLPQRLVRDLDTLNPETVIVTRPGDIQLYHELRGALAQARQSWQLREDPHFLSTPADFAEWAQGRKQLRMEYFYRQQRLRHGVLLDGESEPRGGRWNFDADNRDSFGKDGPPEHPTPHAFAPDAITHQVIKEVERDYADHPGECSDFDWPVTAADAEQALGDFISHRLPRFGQFQDAIWTGAPYLFHSRLSAAMNLHLISPRRVIDAAIEALENAHAPIAAVEGFIRQILGWREFVRGIYWYRADKWDDDNALDAETPLPQFYWTGDSEMQCMADALAQTLQHGYAHHIQRLMVTGLYALLLGVRPKDIEAWYHAIYVDAVAWVEVPNTVGMSQYANGGVLASKPYIASGAYIDRMSNACAQCRFNPKLKTGAKACPFTTLYWDFLIRHEQRFANHPRLRMQLRNLQRLDTEARSAIQAQASRLRS